MLKQRKPECTNRANVLELWAPALVKLTKIQSAMFFDGIVKASFQIIKQ